MHDTDGEKAAEKKKHVNKISLVVSEGREREKKVALLHLRNFLPPPHGAGEGRGEERGRRQAAVGRLCARGRREREDNVPEKKKESQ